MYDYSKLKGRIVEICGNNEKFCIEIGLSTHSLSVKLNNKIDFRQREIYKACEVLDIPTCEIADYFFKKKTQ